ncbi:MAG: hypothetical protein HQL29_05110 [Candidatus Omnitrophica bacterium]|nr:hypothetical protein [Candidatus Omnitrophota bacterium]
MIQDEISLRIKKAVEFNNQQRDIQEAEKLEAQKIKFDISEAGWMAEIDNMEKIVEKVKVMRSELKDLHFRTFQRAKDLAMVTAENKHEGTNIIQSVAASVGKLDIIGKRAEDICKEMEDSREKDEDILGIG